MRDGPRLDDLAFFVSVVRAGGVRAAAARSGLPRSTVSRRLDAFERALGVALVRRAAGRLELTEAGRAHFDEAARLVDGAERLFAGLRGGAREPRGVLRVAASPLFAEDFLPPLVAAYARRHAGVRVEVLLDPLRVDLAAANVDVAFRAGPLDDTSAFSALRLGTTRVGLFAAPAYLARRGAPESPAALAGHDLIVIAEPGRPVRWAFARGARPRLVRGKVQAASFTLARRLCVEGAGVARAVTLLFARELEAGAVVPVLEPYWVTHEVHAIFPRGGAAGPKTRAFLDLVKAAFAGGPPWARPASP
ncbi:MAG TPA: LysR substrate-binding domain-containing protein [Polyangiaceae bacterium]|nr:LysR substrate-binding domain-containing protein [Polyangiaceae bacterium]